MCPERRPRDTLTTSLIVLGVVVLTAGILHFEGRRWWCACGVPRIWDGDINSAHCSQHLLDPYVFTHVLHGVGLCGILALAWPRLRSRWSFLLTLVIEALWEVVENSAFVIERYRTTTMALGYEGDSVVNSLGDMAACALGWGLARRLGWRWSIAVWILTELILLLWIRDNLFLNVLMLLWPSEAIKQWQMVR